MFCKNVVRNITATLFVAAFLFGGCYDGVSGETGTVNSAESLKTALANAKPGDVIVWQNGDYQSLKIQFKGNGTAEAPITLKAETPGKVVLKGASQIKLSGSWLVVEGFAFTATDSNSKNSPIMFASGSSNCRVSDCSIDGKDSMYSETDCKWVSIYGHDNEISHCSFSDKRTMGCLLVVWMEEGIVPRHRILNNYFHRPYTHVDENGKARNGQESIRIGTSTFSLSDACCTVSGNYFEKCDGELAEIISNKSCRNLYEGNLFVDSVGSLTLRHGNYCVVRGNYFYTKGKANVGGVRIIGENHLVEGNFFLGMTGSGYKSALCLVRGESNAELNGYAPVVDAVIKDNLFIGCKNAITEDFSGRDSQDTAPVGTVYQNNRILSAKEGKDFDFSPQMDAIKNESGKRW